MYTDRSNKKNIYMRIEKYGDKKLLGEKNYRKVTEGWDKHKVKVQKMQEKSYIAGKDNRDARQRRMRFDEEYKVIIWIERMVHLN